MALLRSSAASTATKVRFSENTIGPAAAVALAAALESPALPLLTSVDLSDIFTGRLTAEIPGNGS